MYHPLHELRRSRVASAMRVVSMGMALLPVPAYGMGLGEGMTAFYLAFLRVGAVSAAIGCGLGLALLSASSPKLRRIGQWLGAVGLLAGLTALQVGGSFSMPGWIAAVGAGLAPLSFWVLVAASASVADDEHWRVITRLWLKFWACTAGIVFLLVTLYALEFEPRQDLRYGRPGPCRDHFGLAREVFTRPQFRLTASGSGPILGSGDEAGGHVQPCFRF